MSRTLIKLTLSEQVTNDVVLAGLIECGLLPRLRGKDYRVTMTGKNNDGELIVWGVAEEQTKPKAVKRPAA